MSKAAVKEKKRWSKKKKAAVIILSVLCALIVLTVAAGVIALNWYCRVPEYNVVQTNQHVSLIAHRGMSSMAPENTTASFEQAGKQFNLRNCGQWYATMPEDQLQRLLDAEPKLRADWDEVYGDRMQKLVFIGQHMNKDMKNFLKEALDGCLVK